MQVGVRPDVTEGCSPGVSHPSFGLLAIFLLLASIKPIRRKGRFTQGNSEAALWILMGFTIDGQYCKLREWGTRGLKHRDCYCAIGRNRIERLSLQ